MILNLIKHQWPDIEKIYLYVKDPIEWKNQLLVSGGEKIEIKILKSPKAFSDYSQTVNNVHEYLEDYNPTRKEKC